MRAVQNLFIVAGLVWIALTPAAARADGDWYMISQTTFTCFDLRTSNYPFHSPAEYLAWANDVKGWLTNVTVMPNVPIGRWIEISVYTDDNNEKELGTADFIQPLFECDAVLGYEQSKGILPNPDDLK